MKLYREVKASERLPEEACLTVIWHKEFGILHCYWVPEEQWWETSDEYAYGNQDIEWWLEPIEITEGDINEILLRIAVDDPTAGYARLCARIGIMQILSKLRGE